MPWTAQRLEVEMPEMRYLRLILCILCLNGLAASMGQEADKQAVALANPHDWPTYNRDVIGTRHNPAERTLTPSNVSTLVEKWRFPAEASGEKIGIVHG